MFSSITSNGCFTLVMVEQQGLVGSIAISSFMYHKLANGYVVVYSEN